MVRFNHRFQPFLDLLERHIPVVGQTFWEISLYKREKKRNFAHQTAVFNRL
jgi:hypothetical protein